MFLITYESMKSYEYTKTYLSGLNFNWKNWYEQILLMRLKNYFPKPQVEASKKLTNEAMIFRLTNWVAGKSQALETLYKAREERMRLNLSEKSSGVNIISRAEAGWGKQFFKHTTSTSNRVRPIAFYPLYSALPSSSLVRRQSSETQSLLGYWAHFAKS